MTPVQSVEERLAALRQTEPNGQKAEEVLRHFSLFLTERFGGPGVRLLVPASRTEQLQIVELLRHGGVLSKSPQTESRYSNWRDTYRPWENNCKYWISAEVIQALHPNPTDEERHFAFYGARLFRYNKGIPQKDVDLYLDLIDWTRKQLPEMVLIVAQRVASCYGGSDLRVYEKVSQIAQVSGRPLDQARILCNMGRIAARQHNQALMAERYEKVLLIGDPETDEKLAYLHIRSLEYLGDHAIQDKRWAQAREFYEKSLALRERFIDANAFELHTRIHLCLVTEKLGDSRAHDRYSEQVRGNIPPFFKWRIDQFRQHPYDEMVNKQRKAYAEQLEWHRRRGTSADVLWHWGRFEYHQGNHQEACQLCRMAILEFEARFTVAHWRNPNKFNYNSRIHEIETQYIKELKRGLALMGCDE